MTTNFEPQEYIISVKSTKIRIHEIKTINTYSIYPK